MLCIDFISDISCPWCALGVSALEKALANIGDDIQIDLHFQPFELNPKMPDEGANLAQYLSDKVGMNAAQVEASHKMLQERGKEVGFHFGKRERIWNTFNAHRLLYWADAEGPAESQRQLKLALMQAYHGEGRNPSDVALLLELVGRVGLNTERARAILESNIYEKEVREAEHKWQQAGISSVPSMVINQKELVQGAQPAEIIVQLLRNMANQ